jgi:hypothetical protein
MRVGGFRWGQAGGLPLLRVTAMESAGRVLAVFTSRRGGDSLFPFGELNLGEGVGDRVAAVAANRKQLLTALGLGAATVVWAEQVHGSRVCRVEKTPRACPQADALISDQPGVILGGVFADCVPVFVYDPRRPAVGLAHAGWRGTAAGVVQRTLEAMAAHFGTAPDRCVAAVGPSIGPCCYQVGEEVLRRLRDALPWDAELLRSGRLDLGELNARVLEHCGVPQVNRAELCTSCNRELFFSHRRDGGRTGRMAALVGILP